MAGKPPDNPFLARQTSRGTTGHGRRSEKRISLSISARLQPNSGAMRGAKGDMKKASYLIEAKSTRTQTIAIEYSWLVKITTEALNKGMCPALTASFTDPEGKGKIHGDWVLIPLHEFQRISED